MFRGAVLGLLFQNLPIGARQCHRLLPSHPDSEQMHLLFLKDQDGERKLLIGSSPWCLVLPVTVFPVSLC